MKPSYVSSLMPTYKEQQILDKVCKVALQKQFRYYDFIPFFDFQYKKIIFNCQPSHFSPCSVVPEDLFFFSAVPSFHHFTVPPFHRSIIPPFRVARLVSQTFLYYINTSEIPSELSRKKLISSHVKITCYLHT